jgi:hypothetical protein
VWEGGRKKNESRQMSLIDFDEDDSKPSVTAPTTATQDIDTAAAPVAATPSIASAATVTTADVDTSWNKPMHLLRPNEKLQLQVVPGIFCIVPRNRIDVQSSNRSCGRFASVN